MAFVRHVLIAVLLTTSAAAQQPPLPSPIPGSKLLQTRTIEGPLEVRPATANDEAILAGLSYTETEYESPANITAPAFVIAYRDALVAGGWKLIVAPKVDAGSLPEGTIDISAHYGLNARNIYLRLSRAPDGRYRMRVADVGAENWNTRLATECRLPVASLHFELDRPVLRLADSEATLRKLADVLKARNAPAVEVQGHMDNVGEAGVASRQALSETRAKVVASWLTSNGVAAAKVTAKGYGKLKPVADNDTDLGRELNRRIEITCRSAAGR